MVTYTSQLYSILDIDDKDKRIQAMVTQLEIKSIDLLKYKAAVEVAKVKYMSYIEYAIRVL